MTDDFQQQLEKVLTEFGMWRAEEKCKPDQEAGEVDFGWIPEWGVPQRRLPYCTMHLLPLEHDIPLPPLTPELAWRCVEAARLRGWVVLIRDHMIIVGDQTVGRARVRANTLAEALITAIAAALETK
jgi:hypothetical protein